MSFGPLKRLPSFEPARQHRARAVLLEAHHGAIVVGAPDQTTLRVEAGAARADEQHVRAPAARLRAGVIDVGAGVAGLLHEHRHGLVGRDLVDHVVEQAADEQVARLSLAHPHRPFVQAEAGGEQFGRGVGGDDVVEPGIGARDVERLRRRGRTVAAHGRRRRAAG